MPDNRTDVSDLRRGFAQARDVERVARISIAAGGRILRDDAKARADALGLRRTGALISNIVIKRERAAPQGTAEYHLGVRHGQHATSGQRAAGKKLVNKGGRIVTKYVNDPYYWRFLEFTTKRRSGTPFLAAALDARRDDALTAISKAVQRYLIQEQKKNA